MIDKNDAETNIFNENFDYQSHNFVFMNKTTHILVKWANLEIHLGKNEKNNDVVE